MRAKNAMLDAMGIYQHHDAISGTAKQPVVDDYVVRLAKSMEKNNFVYGKILKDKATHDLNLSISNMSTFANGN